MSFTTILLLAFAATIGGLTIATLVTQPEKLTPQRFKTAILTAIITGPIVALGIYLLWRTPLTTELFFRSYLAQIFVIYILNSDGKSYSPFILTHVKDGHPFRIRFSLDRGDKENKVKTESQ